ncbi:hypothetical protein ACF05W_37260 [Streptomyces lydicus]|uniref:hypothetical protein n=1 Tax=Streptomyces lydicus TaxID=47763 RepID=UPI0036FAC6DE
MLLGVVPVAAKAKAEAMEKAEAKEKASEGRGLGVLRAQGAQVPGEVPCCARGFASPA